MSKWKMTLDELVAGSEGKVLSKIQDEFSGVGTDTRANLKNLIFFALKGDTFDAHDFLAKAVEAEAAALVVHRLPESVSAVLQKVTVVEVPDTLVAMQKLAHFWRHKMPAQILGVTGTNGKTTTKEFSAALIGESKKVQYSKGSFNNHWGVPISLLSIDPSHEVAIIEMGMNHPGELQTLSRIVDADAVVVTMVGRGHLEGVGTVEGVAQAKAEIYEYSPSAAMRIFNLENPHTREMYQQWRDRVPESQIVTFAGLDFARKSGIITREQVSRAPSTLESASAWPRLDVALEVVSASPESLHIRGEIQGVGGETIVPVFGTQNVTNLMVASCFALAAGMSPHEIWLALPKCRTAWGRNQWVKTESGARILFDAYNANPESMRAAVENFSALTPPQGGRKFALLGEMKELGSHTEELHRELGALVARAGFDQVLFVGPSHGAFSAGMELGGSKKRAEVSSSYENKLAVERLPVLQGNDIVLIKGSRGVQLEKAMTDLKAVDFAAKK